jgi:antitoxin CptB
MNDVVRKKLRFRAGHRGFREMDLFMEAFADRYLGAFGDRELAEFERILDIPDQDVYSWITGQAAPPEGARSQVLDLLISFSYPAGQTDGAQPGG